MSSSAHRIAEKNRKANAAPTETAADTLTREGYLISLIERNRVAVYATPFCLAGIMVLLDTFGGKRFHEVINFLVRIPQ